MLAMGPESSETRPRQGSRRRHAGRSEYRTAARGGQRDREPACRQRTACHVAEIAAAAAATCDTAYSQAANGHLIDLFAALPLPGTTEGKDFWERIRGTGGSAAWNIHPANIGGPFFRRVRGGNEGGVASRA